MIEIDARGMAPPRPFELVMEALSTLAPDEALVLRLDREPYPLYRVLERNGYRHRTTRHGDADYEIEIRQRAPD
jgi:uncharacterized protein (DUF2249 family)